MKEHRDFARLEEVPNWRKWSTMVEGLQSEHPTNYEQATKHNQRDCKTKTNGRPI